MKPKHAAAAALGSVQTVPVTALLAQVLLIAGLAVTVSHSGTALSPAAWGVGIACGLITNAALSRGLSHYRTERLNPADWVTLVRATLTVGVAALIAGSFGHHVPVSLMVTLAAVALALDAVDGWVARRTRSATLGAHFDAEVDSFLIFILSVYVARWVGAWVLAIGLARYAFLAAGWPLPWLRGELPPRFWRKTVAAIQGVMLVLVASHLLSAAVSRAILAVSLALLAESFGRDVWWLWRRRGGTLVAAVTDADSSLTDAVATPDASDPETGSGGSVPPDPASGRAPDGGPRPPRYPRARRWIGPALTLVAVVILWAALVFPDQPSDLSFTGFLRIPLEGLALIALASVLPRIPQRIFAGVIGPLIALVVVFKVLDIGFLETFNRRLDILSDYSQVGTGIETLRTSIGPTETNLVVVGVVVGVVVLVILTTLSAFRVTRVAAANRRWTLRTVAGLAAVWGLLWLAGAQLTAQTPIASTLSASVFGHEVSSVRADLHDNAVFAAQVKRDALRNTPTSQLLTGLRGKDVLLVFIEAYGQQAVEGRQFSPEVDAVLSKGDKQLASEGFSARSGFLDSATYGGISWLAHSTLQSGVWVNSQRRYNDLMTTNRFTLSDAFKQAGWRTIDDVPSNDYYWPQGTSYYHYDKLYDRRNVGYKGPTYTYASMPDEYTYAALQRLELSKTHRKPLFAEVDTVSSHMPWNRIPEQVPWNQLGNGSIFNKIPEDHSTGAFWSNPPRVQAAYGRSIVYSLNALLSFFKHDHDKNLVMIMLGDHQPLPIVSGHNSNHDVPISIIAHDPKVLKQIGSWGWNAGLQPKPTAPVWPMSAFRNQFLGAFDSHTAG
ncbi:MAG TPA: CDP-alcohol phosphatidyltransferase family protein [Solirubrobacteraceae bacterium]|nr:CDP-alcohol phosphatidyltransferase family protein [Solirubrobacteraceae bacterium]